MAASLLRSRMQRLPCSGAALRPGLQLLSSRCLPLLQAGRGCEQRLRTSRWLCTSPRRLFPAVHVYFPEGGAEFGVVKAFPRKEGSSVEAGDVVAEVESGHQQLLDVQTARSGVVVKFLRKKGEVVRPGDALVELDVTLSEAVMGWWRTLQGQADGGAKQ
mmetsp:Transcript_7452/g.11814  ORF Transcript_7452/g.11814 Transcript_7452/m.11814 type:complete len:160 (-) Transcript_7452:47-526(-)